MFRRPNPRVGRSRVVCGALAITPSTIYGSDLKLWLRADLGVTLNGGDVSAWANQGTLGGSFDQGTPANQPLFTASDANLNGQPSVTFTGANSDRLVSSLAASAWNFLHDGTGATLFVVCRPTGGSGTRTLIGNSGGPTARGFRLEHVPASDRFELRVSDGASNVIAITGSANAAEPVSLVAMFTHRTSDTPDVTLYYNPSTTSRGTGSGTPSASDAAAALYVGTTTGAANAFDGPIAELIAVTGVDAAKIASVQAYLLARYGFQ